MTNESLKKYLSAIQSGMFGPGGVFTLAAMILAFGSAVPVNAQAIYSSIIQPLQGNVAFSAGPEAYGYRELGDGLVFTPGTGRTVTNVKVVFSSFACTSGRWYTPLPNANACVTVPGSTFAQPVTLNIYAVTPANEPGALLATVTQTFQIPYRPSSQAQCADGTSYFNATDNGCDHGIATLLNFDLSGLNLQLPDRVIVGFTFNTTHYGYAPIGTGAPCYSTSAGCPYDALNISTDSSAIIGANIDPNGIYVNWVDPANSCTGLVSGAFLLDTPCWTGLHPEIEVDAVFGPPGTGGTFQVRYLSNLNVGDGVVDIVNNGQLTGPGGVGGNICVNVYAFSPDEQEISCCSCLLTPNALANLSGRNDLISNTLTPAVPTSIVVKLLATIPGTGAGPGVIGGPTNGTVCNAAFPFAAANLAQGLDAWATSVHALPGPPVGNFGVTETPFTRSTLSPAEITRITALCQFNTINGSGFGICRSCRFGGLGGAKQ